MPVSESFLTVVIALMLFTAFIKIATALTIFRFGAGLHGFEFGITCLLVAFALAIAAAPPELRKLGFPGKFFNTPAQVNSSEVTSALLPYMQSHIDEKVAQSFAATSHARSGKSQNGETPESTATKDATSGDLGSVIPAFVISQLKQAFTIGCALLIPFVLIDLIVAHLLTLIGIVQLQSQIVALPLKLLLFVAVDGWSLLAHKLLEM